MFVNFDLIDADKVIGICIRFTGFVNGCVTSKGMFKMYFMSDDEWKKVEKQLASTDIDYEIFPEK